MFDQNGINMALNKAATQSSTGTPGVGWKRSASNAVNGNLNDMSHTDLNEAK